MNRLVSIALGWVIMSAVLLPSSAAGQAEPNPYLIGVNIYFRGIDGDDGTIIRQRLTDALDARAKAGDTAVTLSIPVFQSGWDANNVGPKAPATPSTALLKWTIEEASARGLVVFVRPLLDEQSIVKSGPLGAWRGTIEPQNVDLWFQHYSTMLTGLAKLAGSVDGSWLVIGAELGSLEPLPQWHDVISKIRDTTTAYPIQLTYAVNWDRADKYQDWYDGLDGLSIDAFFPLDLESDATVSQVAEAMDVHRDAISLARTQMGDRPVFLGEVGIASQSGHFDQPWFWANVNEAPVNLETQRRYVAAACDTYAPEVDGLFWWAVFLHEIPDPTRDSSFSLTGKPAELEANRCSARYGVAR